MTPKGLAVYAQGESKAFSDESRNDRAQHLAYGAVAACHQAAGLHDHGPSRRRRRLTAPPQRAPPAGRLEPGSSSHGAGSVLLWQTSFADTTSLPLFSVTQRTTLPLIHLLAASALFPMSFSWPLVRFQLSGER